MRSAEISRMPSFSLHACINPYLLKSSITTSLSNFIITPTLYKKVSSPTHHLITTSLSPHLLIMDPTKEIQFETEPVIRTNKDGTVERLFGTDFSPPGLDPSTRTTSKDVLIDPQTNLRARIYLPESASSDPKKLPILVYFHGGGFCVESAFSPTYQKFLNTLSARSDIIIVSVDYRLAPENPIPVPYDDSWRALQWVVTGSDAWLSDLGDFGRVFLAGDSAGGNIAHHMAVRVGEVGFGSGSGVGVEGLVLIHPFFWGTERMDSELDPDAPVKLSVVDGLWKYVCGTNEVGNDDPRLNPLVGGAKWVGALGCYRILVTVGGKDMLRDRGRAYYEKIKESGWKGEVEFFETEGGDHVFYILGPSLRR